MADPERPREREVEGVVYYRDMVKTHKIAFGEDLMENIEKYAVPLYKEGAFIVLSDRIVGVCQNQVRHISTVKVGLLAKLLVKGVKKYPSELAFSVPEKMQLVVELCGKPRIILGMIVGGITRVFGIKGMFWKIIDNRADEIDGFIPYAMDPYKDHAVLPPKDPKGVCDAIEDRFGFPAAIVDANNRDAKVVAMSKGVPVDSRLLRLIILDNPHRQGPYLTPFLFVSRKSGNS